MNKVAIFPAPIFFKQIMANVLTKCLSYEILLREKNMKQLIQAVSSQNVYSKINYVFFLLKNFNFLCLFASSKTLSDQHRYVIGSSWKVTFSAEIFGQYIFLVQIDLSLIHISTIQYNVLWYFNVKTTVFIFYSNTPHRIRTCIFYTTLFMLFLRHVLVHVLVT